MLTNLLSSKNAAYKPLPYHLHDHRINNTYLRGKTLSAN